MAAAPRCPSPVLILLLLASCCVATSTAAGADEKKLIHLHFYFHEVNAGEPNATVVNVASLHSNASTFGDVYVFDNPLLEGPDPSSKLIGRVHGYTVFASLDGSRVLASADFVFSDDHPEYGGSSLTTQGHFDASGGPSERSIVGGTGKLRFARGYFNSRLHSSTNSTITVVFDMHFTLDH